ncbi:MAG: hypothetical protein IC227_03035 [Enterococcus lacertideformus]|uniref:Uncharacterized protein n=1 Tax=Enterococcus lacertideformus TaxID=2771493 RepID=A0A931F874_9ENTE|nr:hypothetical protein [Enterococcus lacertideformus]
MSEKQQKAGILKRILRLIKNKIKAILQRRRGMKQVETIIGEQKGTKKEQK